MKYLLSTGKSTSDNLVYLKDVILINMKILKSEIPYYTGGSFEIIKEYDTNKVKNNINVLVTNILDRISNSFPNIPLSLESIDITYSIINVNIKIGKDILTYEIKGTN